jgi:putative pyruvate formate lyase activating enzyme
MTDFDRLFVWDDPALTAALQWYRDVAENRRPAKFRIAASLPVSVALDAPEEVLWAELDRQTPVFDALWRGIRTGEIALPSLPHAPTLLDLCRALTYRMLAHCNFCQWNCRVDRSHGTKLGACKLGSGSRVSTYFHHPGEELVYRGTQGSGTIFFTSCNMRCTFCQNGAISTDKDNGEEVSPRTLASMAWLLRIEGCHNINWVGGDPTIHLHAIVDAIAMLGAGFAPTRGDLASALPAKADRVHWFERNTGNFAYAGGFNAPMLWNSNFFMTREAMKILRLLMDVWLPDFKFGPGPCAMKLAKTPWYWETVTRNLLSLRDWGEDFTIRHLVMPAHVECCTYAVLDWVAAHTPNTPVNVMDQYRPDNFCEPRSAKYRPEYQAIARHPFAREIAAAYAYAARKGVRFETITHEKQRSRGGRRSLI